MLKNARQTIYCRTPGGPLKKEQHYLVITWACDCAENVLHLFGEMPDERLKNALHVANEWKSGNASVGDAMKASVAAHAVARESSHPASIAVDSFCGTGCCNCSYG